MRLPGAGLLIVLGLVALWLAVTGKLDKLATAWDYVRDKTPSPESGKTGLPGLTKPAVNTLSSVVDIPSYHMGNMLNTLAPGGSSNPGGML